MKKEGFNKSLLNPHDSYLIPKDQTFTTTINNNFSSKTTEKLYEILDFFEKQPKPNISYQKNPSHYNRLNNFKTFNDLKGHFVDPQSIVSKAKVKYEQEKNAKTTRSLVSEEAELLKVHSHRPKNFITIKKGNIEKCRPNHFQNEQLLAFIKNKSTNIMNLNKNCSSKTLSRNTPLITEPSRIYNENKRINDFYCTLTNSKSKFLIPNFASSINEAFPHLSESLSPAIINEQESFKINENKQIMFFNKILDSLIVKFDEMPSGKEIPKLTENLGKMISIFDAIYQDFCAHLEVSSLHRSNFCKRIWKKHQEYYQKLNENLVKYYQDINTKSKVFSNKLKDDNDSLNKILHNTEQEFDKLKKKYADLLEENKQLAHDLSEKDIELKESRNKEKQRKIEENEFIKDIQDLVLTNNIDQILHKERKSEYAKVLNILKNFQARNISKKIERKNTIASRTLNTVDNMSNGPSLEVSKILGNRNLRINYLGQKYFGIKSADNPNNLVRIENGKKEKENSFELRRKKILDDNILNQCKPLFTKISSELTSINNFQFKLYLNKGVDFMKESVKDESTQTELFANNFTEQSIQNDLQSFISWTSSSVNNALEGLKTSLDTIQKSFKLGDVKLNIEEFNCKLKQLNGFISQNREISQDNDVLISTINEAKILMIKLNEGNDKLCNEMNNIIHECEVVINNNENIVELFDQINENQENLVESYQEVSKLILKGYTNIKSKIEKYLLEKDNINSYTFGNLVRKLFDKDYETIGEDKAFTMMLMPSFKTEIKPLKNSTEVEKIAVTLKKNELLMIPEEDLSASQSLIVESLRSHINIKLALTRKKVMKIINSIYFQFLSKIYIKNEENWFDEPFTDPSDLSYVYFSSLFGVEKISVRKYSEFLMTCFLYNKDLKRVQMFTKYFLKTENKTFVFDKKNNHNFIQKNIILFIILLKEINDTEKIVFKVEENEKIDVYLLSNKVQTVFEKIIYKYPVSSELKGKISIFFANSRKNFTKNLKDYSVIDFDSFLDFYCEVFQEIKQSLENYVKIIFKALTYEKIEGKVSKFEYVICLSVLFNKKANSLEDFENQVEKFKSDDELTLTQFKHFVLTNNHLSIVDFKKLLHLDKNTISDLYSTFYNEITSNSNLTDLLTRRVNVLKNNPCSKSLNKKIKAMSLKVTNDNQTVNEENMLIRWLIFRLLDIVSFQIYNDARLHSICNPISDIIEDFSKCFGEGSNKNLLFTYVISNENNM